MKSVLCTALALCATLSLSMAAEKASKNDKADKSDKKSESSGSSSSTTLDKVKLGELITGPEVKLDEIKGRGVVLEFWGIHCGPCLASLPDMEKLNKRHKDELTVIGSHAQNGTDDEVKAVVKKNRLSYTIVKGTNPPTSFSGIPHAYVFDATGKMLFEGHPADKEFDKAVRDAVKSSKDAAKAGGATAKSS